MDYKEKYERALSRARKLATDLPNGRNDRLYHVGDLEYIFPELAEREDEKIRRTLLEYLLLERKGDLCSHPERQKWIDWLEKKKEPKSIESKYFSIKEMVEKYRYEDEYDEDGNLKGKPVNCMVRAYEKGIKDTIAWFEKQKDNKLTGDEIDDIFKQGQDSVVENPEDFGLQKIVEPDTVKRDLWVYVREWVDSFDRTGKLPKDEDEIVSCVDYVMKRQKKWSEEDERRFEYCKRLVYASDKYSIEDRKETVDWLNSLKPRWKPSEEQMSAFNYFIKSWGDSDEQLEYVRIFNLVKSLYDELKKL